MKPVVITTQHGRLTLYPGFWILLGVIILLVSVIAR